MIKLKSVIGNFSRVEILLWGASAVITVLSFLIFDRTNYLTLTASL